MLNPWKKLIPLALGSALLPGCSTEAPEAKKTGPSSAVKRTEQTELAKPVKSGNELIKNAAGLTDADKQWLLKQNDQIILENQTGLTNSRVFPAQYGKAIDTYLVTPLVIETLTKANNLIKELQDKGFIEEAQIEKLKNNLKLRELTSIAGKHEMDGKSYPEKTYNLYRANINPLEAAVQATSKEEALEILKPFL